MIYVPPPLPPAPVPWVALLSRATFGFLLFYVVLSILLAV